MKKSITDYYKRTVELAGNATRAISKARADYERDSVLLKNAYEADMYGERGYREKLEEMKSARDAEVQAALSRILTVVDEYDAEMAELGKLDGDKIDEGTMRILSSGMKLTHADYQELANKHADNAVMSRILKERYDANRPEEKGPGITVVQFGQSPESRSEVFSKFVKTVYHAVESGVCPALSGRGKLKSQTDYHNFIAQQSLAEMQPIEGEDFCSLDKDFPVETVNGKVENAGSATSSFSPFDFNFGFTPIR